MGTNTMTMIKQMNTRCSMDNAGVRNPIGDTIQFPSGEQSPRGLTLGLGKRDTVDNSKTRRKCDTNFQKKQKTQKIRTGRVIQFLFVMLMTSSVSAVFNDGDLVKVLSKNKNGTI